MTKFAETGLETLTNNCQNWTEIMKRNAIILNNSLLFISGLGDVEITSLSHDDILAYNTSSQKWVNTPKSSIVPSTIPKVLGQFRERDKYSSYNPDMTFEKSDFAEITITSEGTSMGEPFFFFHIQRNAIHGKKVRVTWEFTTNTPGIGTYLKVMDGKYERDVDGDWGLENDSSVPLKGSSAFQVISHVGSFSKVTETTGIIDSSTGTQDTSTISVEFRDAWAGGTATFKITEFALLDASDVKILEIDFTQEIVMELEGTTGDYGYIGTGTAVATSTTTTSSSSSSSSTQSSTSTSSSSSTTTTS